MTDLRGWVAEERARERARAAELRHRETFPQTGPGGQAFPATPIVRSRRANVPPVNVVRNPPYGRSVTVQTTQVFDGGGTACQWANVKSGLTSAGFRSWIANLPQTSFEVPTTGYYDLHLSVEWDVWEQGGFVRVLKNDTVLWFDQAPYGKSFARTFHLGVLTPDDVIVVEVSPVGDDTVQPDGKTADVVGSFDLVELPVQVATDPVGGIKATFAAASQLRAGAQQITLPGEAAVGDAVLLVIANNAGTMSGGSGTYHQVEDLAAASGRQTGTFTDGDALWSYDWASGISTSNSRARTSLWWLPLDSALITKGHIDYETGVLGLSNSGGTFGNAVGVLIGGGGSLTPSHAGADGTGAVSLEGGLIAVGTSNRTHTGNASPPSIDPSRDLIVERQSGTDGAGGVVRVWPADGGPDTITAAGWSTRHMVGWA